LPIDKTLLPKGVDVPDEDLQRLPQSVIALILLLLKTIEELTAKLKRDSSNSNRPSSTDAIFTGKKRKLKTEEESKKGKPGARKGHIGHRQMLLEPTETIPVPPKPCGCGGVEFHDLEPYYTHQYIELPKILLPVTHFILLKGRCASCGKIGKGYVPHEYRYGFGPRFTALVAEIAGIAGNSRDTVRAFCASVLNTRISLGTIQKIIDRGSAATLPYYEAIRDKARSALINHLDETSWKNGGKLHWLWVMVNPLVAFFMIHANRSQKAFEQLIGYWNGILVSDNYAVYRKWTNLRQTCLAHLIRQAEALAQRKDKELAACGKWARRTQTPLQNGP
jgi:transposase